MSLAGRIALITGAGSGIGRATCRLLNRDGATIIAADRNFDATKETLSLLTGKNLNLELDVSSKQSVQNAVAEIRSKYKTTPTIVVNAAGILRDNFILKMDEKSFDEVIQVNLKGTFLVMQEVAAAFVEQNLTKGSFINIGSIVGKIGNMGQANYTASKAGVEIITKTAAKEFGKFGIRVNCVVPGMIETPMIADVPQKVKDIMLMGCPLRRFGKPEEVAETIAFLASDRSSYINAASIDVTGGM